MGRRVTDVWRPPFCSSPFADPVTVADFWRYSYWSFAQRQPCQANPLFCAQQGRTDYRIKNINIDIDFLDPLCYKMNSNGVVAKTLGFGRCVARERLSQDNTTGGDI
jgi:hypothetical protein